PAHRRATPGHLLGERGRAVRDRRRGADGGRLTDLEPEPVGGAMAARAAADVRTSLNRLGLAMQVIGVAGAVAWLVLIYLSWDRFGPVSSGLRSVAAWKSRVLLVLQPISIL